MVSWNLSLIVSFYNTSTTKVVETNFWQHNQEHFIFRFRKDQFRATPGWGWQLGDWNRGCRYILVCHIVNWKGLSRWSHFNIIKKTRQWKGGVFLGTEHRVLFRLVILLVKPYVFLNRDLHVLRSSTKKNFLTKFHAFLPGWEMRSIWSPKTV